MTTSSVAASDRTAGCDSIALSRCSMLGGWISPGGGGGGPGDAEDAGGWSCVGSGSNFSAGQRAVIPGIYARSQPAGSGGPAVIGGAFSLREHGPRYLVLRHELRTQVQ